MIALDLLMAALEADGSHVRLYHAKSLGMWVAQTFPDETMGRARAYACAAAPEAALERLALLSGVGPTGEAVLALMAALRGLSAVLAAERRAKAWGQSSAIRG